jgi:hypothetical protein
MIEIESFDFFLGMVRLSLGTIGHPEVGTVAVTATQANDSLEAELAAWNQAFCELELPWRWDAPTFRHLMSVAADQDLVGTYVERNQAHLLRAYEKAFLCELVYSAHARYRAENRPAAG